MIGKLILALSLIALDKVTTWFTLRKAKKLYPTKWLSMEKNIVQKKLIEDYGLVPALGLYSLFSLFAFFFIDWLLAFIVGGKVSLAILAGVYAAVIVNNINHYRRLK